MDASDRKRRNPELPEESRALSRREALVLGLAGAGAGLTAALAGGAGWRFVPPEYPGKGKLPIYDMVVPTTCAECGDGCGLLCFVKGARLIAVQGNPDHPGNRGAICLKSFAGINQIYDPERVLSPLRRDGPRGSRRWTRIGWDEALDLAAKGIGAGGGGKAPGLFFEDGSFEGSAGFATRFLDAAGVRRRLVRREFEEANATAARSATFGLPNAFPDVENARTILNFGADPLESGRFFLVLARRLVEAVVRHRAKVVTFDARLSNTAGCSHEWFPVAPGAEGLVALVLAGEVVRSGRFDRAFVERRTNASAGELAAHLASYTPEAAEKAGCGVSADALRRVAAEFAAEGPSLAIAGAGALHHSRGVQTQRCVDLLNVLAGAVDRAGGIDLYPAETTWFAPVDPVPPPIPPEKPALLRDALEARGEVKAYFGYMANPAFSMPDAGRVAELLKDEARVPFSVVCDTHLTETAELADVFLPAATPFETWGVQPGFQTVSIRRPAAGFLGEMPALREPKGRGRPFSEIRKFCRPLGESRGIADVLIALAKRLGPDTGRYFEFEGIEDYLARACREGPVFGEGGYGALCEKQFVSLPPTGDLLREGFPTASGKVEVRGPGGLPSSDWRERPLGPSSFVLLPYVPSTSSSVSSNAKWLYEVIHRNPLWVSPEAARRLGVAAGDRVRVTSEAGSVEAAVRVTEGIHPGAVAIAQGFGHTAVGRIARAQAFESEDPDTGLLWWGPAGAGVNPSVVVLSRTDPDGGGVAWMDTEVRVERLG
jgi:anaerobic selenocysteine-containing dehydrogenase